MLFTTAHPVSAMRAVVRGHGAFLLGSVAAAVLVAGCSLDSGSGGLATEVPSFDTASISPSPTTARECPVGIVLPDGVDPRACGPVPAEAQQFAQEVSDAQPVFYGPFTSPSRNIACDVGYGAGGYVSCTIEEYSFTAPPSSPECVAAEVAWAGQDIAVDTDVTVGTCRGDVTMAENAMWEEEHGGGEPVRVLQYGDLISQGDIACLSAEDGMTCWNGITGHGFRLSKESQLTW